MQSFCPPRVVVFNFHGHAGPDPLRRTAQNSALLCFPLPPQFSVFLPSWGHLVELWARFKAEFRIKFAFDLEPWSGGEGEGVSCEDNLVGRKFCDICIALNHSSQNNHPNSIEIAIPPSPHLETVAKCPSLPTAR